MYHSVKNALKIQFNSLIVNHIRKQGSSLVFRSRRQPKKTAFFFCISTCCYISATYIQQNRKICHPVETPQNSPKKAVSTPNVLQNVLHKNVRLVFAQHVTHHEHQSRVPQRCTQQSGKSSADYPVHPPKTNQNPLHRNRRRSFGMGREITTVNRLQSAVP